VIVFDVERSRARGRMGERERERDTKRSQRERYARADVSCDTAPEET
jgi:hypothetical protein